MATLASTIISDAARILQDDTNVTWPQAELLSWLNAGQREIVLGKPDAYVKNESVQLVTGTKQTIPAAGNIFMKLTRNMGADGTTPGRVILPIPLQVLDEQNPDWHKATPAVVAQHSGYDERDKKHFYVFPPQPTTPGYVEIIYSVTPPDATLNGEIALSDLYQSALLDYVLYRAYSKDAEYARNDAKAQSYYQAFIGHIIGKSNGETKNEASNSLIGNQRAGKKAA